MTTRKVMVAFVLHLFPIVVVIGIALVSVLTIIPSLPAPVSLMVILGGLVLCVLPITHLVLLRCHVYTPLTTMSRIVPILLLAIGMDVGILIVLAEYVTIGWMTGMIGVVVLVIVMLVIIPSWEGVRSMVINWDTLNRAEQVAEVERLEAYVDHVIRLQRGIPSMQCLESSDSSPT